jgi:hypothetical protein
MSDENIKNQNKELMDDYKNRGFKNRFVFDSGNLVDTDNGNRFKPEDIQVLEEHKLDANGKPTEDILMVFRTKNQVKGLFTIDEDAREDLQLKEFFKAIPDRNIVQNEPAYSTGKSNKMGEE